MSPLWEKQNNTKPMTIHNRPSSRCDKKTLPFTTQSPFFIEGTSLFTFLGRKVLAGMTVEAAIVLPLFLFFFLNLSCAMEMIRLHGNLELALWQTGNKMSIRGYLLWPEDAKEGKNPQSGTEPGSEAKDAIFSYIYIKRQIVKYAGECYLEESPLIYGTDSLQFLESEIFTSQDEFKIVLTYGVSPWISMKGIHPFRMANKYYGHIWNGYGIPGVDDTEDWDGETVYIAENGEVYHTDRYCTHLQLTIKEVKTANIGKERNGAGKKYTLCEKCGEETAPDKVYIGVEGDRYHYDRDCPGLTRTVYAILRIEAGKYRPCSRCEDK